MYKINETFLENYCDESFAEFVSDFQVTLGKKNRNYKELNKQKSQLLAKYPNVRKVVESDVCCNLSAKEATALSDYLNLMDSCSTIEQREIFLSGMKEAYYLFRKLNIIK